MEGILATLNVGVVDLLGVVAPGFILALLIDAQLQVSATVMTALGLSVGKELGATYLIILCIGYMVAGYLIAMLFHTASDLTERMMRENFILDPLFWAGCKVNLEEEAAASKSPAATPMEEIKRHKQSYPIRRHKKEMNKEEPYEEEPQQETASDEQEEPSLLDRVKAFCKKVEDYLKAPWEEISFPVWRFLKCVVGTVAQLFVVAYLLFPSAVTPRPVIQGLLFLLTVAVICLFTYAAFSLEARYSVALKETAAEKTFSPDHTTLSSAAGSKPEDSVEVRALPHPGTLAHTLSASFAMRESNPWLQTYLVDKGNVHKRTLYDGFAVMMRNMLWMLAALQWGIRKGSRLEGYAGSFLFKFMSGWQQNPYSVWIRLCVVFLMVLRYAHNRYLKYKYSYEDYLKVWEQEKNQPKPTKSKKKK